MHEGVPTDVVRAPRAAEARDGLGFSLGREAGAEAEGKVGGDIWGAWNKAVL